MTVLGMFVILILCMNMAFIVLLERKIMAYIQSRKGPKSSGPLGLFQSIADFMKVLSKKKKELMSTQKKVTSPAFFVLSCMVVLVCLLFVSWLMGVDVDNWLLMYFILVALSGFCMTMIGWGSSKKFSMLAVVRVCMSSLCNDSIFVGLLFILGGVTGSYSMMSFFNAKWCVAYLVPWCYFIWLCFCVAEIYRSPFDFQEGESETVSGVKVEYTHIPFLMLYVFEYLMVFVFSLITSVFFYGGDTMSLMICMFHLMLFLVTRACFPRIRFDAYMLFIWKYMMITVMVHCFIAFLK